MLVLHFGDSKYFSDHKMNWSSYQNQDKLTGAPVDCLEQDIRC